MLPIRYVQFLVVASLALAQTYPSPVLVGEPIPLETRLTVRISDLPGGLIDVKVYRNGVEDKARRISPQVSSGEIGLTLDNELVAGEVIAFTQTISGVESAKSAPYKVPVIPRPTVQIISAQGFFAYNAIPIAFKATGADAVTFKVCKDIPCLQPLAAWKADSNDLKKGKAEIALPRPLATDEILYLHYQASRPGVADTRSVEPVEIRVEGLDFRLDTTPAEGQQELRGKAASFIKGLVVYVFGGAYAQARIPDQTTLNRMETQGQAPSGQVPDGYELLQNQLATRLNVEFAPRSPRSMAKNRVPATQSATRASVPTTDEQDFVANEMRDQLFTNYASIEKGSFTFTLKQRLDAGQRLMFCAVIENEPGLSKHYCDATNYVVQSVAIDYGRLRAYFSAGTVISSGNNSFGKTDPYLAFNGDLAFWNHLLVKKTTKSTSKTTDPCRANLDCLRNSPFGISLHGFLDVRLTQAASDTKSDTAKSPAVLGPSPQQAGVFLAGLYLPIRFKGMDWVYQGIQYSAYLAPVGKFGVTYLKDGVILRQTSVSRTTTVEDLLRLGLAPAKDTPKPEVTPVTATNPLPFYGYGLRLGLMKYDMMGRALSNRQISPDNLAYLEVTYGQNGIYRRVGPGPKVEPSSEVTTSNFTKTTVLTETTKKSYTLVPGFNIEGRLKLPHLPAQIGVDVFFHRRLPDQSATADFRFILGFRVDVAKALGRAFGVTP